MGKFWTFTVVDARVVLFEILVLKAQRVVDPFTTELVFQGMEYIVPLGVDVDPISVLDANDAPKLPA